MDYGSYSHLLFERHADGVLLITMNRPEVYNAADEVMHSQLAKLWTDVARDDETRVAVITGAGKAFSAGGDLAMVQRMAGNYDRTAHMLGEMSDLVYSMINCEKPIISAINGVAVGPAWSSGCWPISASARPTRGLGTGMSSSARPLVITPPLSGRCCAVWLRLAITC